MFENMLEPDEDVSSERRGLPEVAEETEYSEKVDEQQSSSEDVPEETDEGEFESDEDSEGEIDAGKYDGDDDRRLWKRVQSVEDEARKNPTMVNKLFRNKDLPMEMRCLPQPIASRFGRRRRNLGQEHQSENKVYVHGNVKTHAKQLRGNTI